MAPDGQISDSGCIFPDSVTTVANQLTTAGLTWKGYMQDMGNDPTRESAVCGHAAIGTPDQTEKAVVGDGYAARHNPFVYFHSIIDNTAYCDAHVVPLGTTSGTMPAGTPGGVTGLATDLKSVATTPNFSFITPNLCYDGHDSPCINQQGSALAPGQHRQLPADLGAAHHRLPRLQEERPPRGHLRRGRHRQRQSGRCHRLLQRDPGTGRRHPGINGPGGGRIGTVLLSPFIKGGTVSTVPYNHYSTLATIEDLFGLPKLGQAKTVTATFGKDVFNQPH